MPISYYKHDLNNRKFGLLKVIAYAGNSKWLVECVCGRRKNSRSTHLVIGQVKSCGTIGCVDNSNRTLSRILPDNEAVIRKVIRSYVAHAKSAGIEFKLNRQQLDRLFSGICFYCGIEPSNLRTGKYGRFKYNGIDRKNPNKGYITSNVVSCCRNCNFSKRRLTTKQFLSLINRIAKHR
jgi:hypothetical protein